MAIAEALLPEFDMETANTRKVLERVNPNELSWQPHEKSMTLGRLASHLAELPKWAHVTVNEDSFDVNPSDGPQMEALNLDSVDAILEAFDKTVAEARGAIAGADDADLMKNWALLNSGEELFSMPKIAVLRSFVMNHMIHHRGQLSVYLRLTGSPVPQVYGPTADETEM